ncbi:MAG TPA: hypothetical protein DCQ51_09645, partial [Planktothrix sp. UBA8407]|nr:hypothetical protein [Planktothrix sp. UBA8407]HBK24326.1 hypothetical protein [Planktothrix sp. UBA10369]
MTNIRVEAESLILTGYQAESGAFASGGGLICLPSDGTIGTVTHNFDLAPGTYDIVVGYYDENDGLSPYSLKQKSSNQDWVNLDSWVANKNLGDSRASAKNFVTRKISNINLTAGDQVQVQGQLHTGEVARIDYIEYIPISIIPASDTTAPTATATAND